MAENIGARATRPRDSIHEEFNRRGGEIARVGKRLSEYDEPVLCIVSDQAPSMNSSPVDIAGISDFQGWDYGLNGFYGRFDVDGRVCQVTRETYSKFDLNGAQERESGLDRGRTPVHSTSKNAAGERLGRAEPLLRVSACASNLPSDRPITRHSDELVLYTVGLIGGCRSKGRRQIIDLATVLPGVEENVSGLAGAVPVHGSPGRLHLVRDGLLINAVQNDAGPPSAHLRDNWFVARQAA